MSKLIIANEEHKTSGFAAHPYTLVRLVGFIDAPNYSSFENTLEKLVKKGAKNVVLDFSQVEYINSTGISAVIRFHSTLSEKDGALILIQVSRNVGLTMHLLGVTTLVPFLKTLKEAEAHLEGQESAIEASADVQQEFARLDGGGKASDRPVFVERSSDSKPTGNVVVAVPKEGPFTQIFERRVHDLKGKYHIVHSVEGLTETLGRYDPDLIVLDHRLPGSDEFIMTLKVETDHSMTSLILLYEKGTDIHRIQGFRVWENDYLLDPFDMMNLFSLAESELRRVPRDKHLFTQQVKFQFDSKRESIDRGLKLGDRLLRKIDIEDAEVTALYAALKEAIDNAVLHGNKHDPEKTVSVNFVVDPRKVTLLIEDEGPGFDYEYFVSQLSTQEAFDRAKARIRAGGRGGLGILLMYKCSDRLEYSGRGNIVRIEKNLEELN